MDEEGLSEEELEGILKQNPQMGITAEKRKELTEQVTAPILKEAEERMTQAVRSRKPVEGLTRQEQIEATPEGQIPARPSGVPSPKADQIALPTTLPKHGIRALFSEGERILERASQVTNLPPESPATQAIAQRMAKGDPFSSEALEDAKAETMRLVKAGLIPNPYYEGFTGKISQAYDILAPLSVEIGVPVATSVALAPLSVNPPLYFSMLGLSSGAANLFAQQMRIGAGFQDETSYMEAAAAAGWGWLPGINIRRLKDASSTVKSIAGGIEGAVMAGGENLTHQGLEMLYGKQKELKGSELLLTSGGGAVIGTVIKRIGAALDIKYDPKEKPYPLIRKAIKDEIKGVRKELNRLKKQGQVRGLKGHQERLDQLEKKLEDLPKPQDDVYQRAIDLLEQHEKQQVESFELFAKEWQESKAAQALKESDVPTAKVEEAKVETEPEAWDPTEVPLGIRRTPVIEPELAALDDEALELAQKQALKDAEPLEDEFFGYPTKGAWFTAPKDLARRLGEAQDKVTAIELEIFRRQIDTEEPWFVATEFNKLTGATEDAENTFKLALLGETIQKRGIQKEVAKELEDKFGRGADAQEVLISKIETAQKAMKTMAEQKKQLQAPMEAPAAEPAPVVTAKPEGEVKQQAREALDDFMAGGGTREVDPLTGKLLDSDDEIKARLLTDDEEKRRLINSVQEAIKEDLANIKGGRESQVEYLAKVQRELDRRLGRETGDEHALVLRAAQLSDNLEVADAINELSIQMTANGVVMVKAFDDILKLAKEKNLDNKADLNDLQTSILKTIPLMLGWKKVGTASGRLLQSRKYTKDQLEVQIEELEKQMEENLVSNLKASKDLTPEELDKQIESFGDIKAVKSLLKAVQQSDDVEELKNILMEQQQTFQNKSSLKKFLDDDTSTYTKVRDVGIDVTYSSMLSAPSTLIKVGIGNAVMSRYHTWMGKVGAKYMALAPWARQGMTKQQFEEAYNFWSKVAMSYGDFNDLALKEGRKAFKTGISDLQTHYESFGESALSMERTGISGALGQSLENAGQFIDVPGKAMARLDARARIRIAHAMTKAKAEYDWRVAKAEGEEVPDNFDEYYQGFLRKVFTEDQARLMTEDQVRRQALLNAEKEGVKAENLASYIDNYVKNNWDKDTSNFVSYVQRNIKEITFTEELGEFTDINKVEAGTKKIESILNDFPLLKTIINPFQRTGRNIIREGLSSTSALASVPGLSKYADKIWAKTMQDLNSGDPIIAARAKGRQVVGAGIIAAAWGLAEAGLYEGMIDQNWKKEENFSIGTGLNPYELRIPVGDQVFGQDINSLEPFATIMNIVADVHTLSKGRMSHKKEAMSALYMLSLVVSNNIGNKSYFKNIGDALELIQVTVESEEAVEAKQKRIIKRLGAGVVPSIMNSMSKATDDWQRRGDTMLNAIAKKISLIAREVPPERDMFGDPIPLHKTDRAKLVSIINPFRLGKQIMDVDDYVITDENGFRGFDLEKLKSIELRETIKGKPNPKYNEQEVRNAAWAIALELDGTYHFNGGSTIKNDIDLQEVIHPETRIDAFHAWQKEYKNLRIDGLTVKQAVIDLAKSWSDSEIDKKTGKVKSVEYVKFDPKKNPEGFKQKDVRLSDLNALLNDYKNVAYDNIEQQYPILLEQKEEEAIRQELQYKRPTTEEAKRLASEMPLQEYKKTQPDTKLKELISKTPYFPAALSD